MSINVINRGKQKSTTGHDRRQSFKLHTHPHTQNDEPLVGSSRASRASRGVTFFLETVQSTKTDTEREREKETKKDILTSFEAKIGP